MTELQWKTKEVKLLTLCPDLILPYAIPSYWSWESWHWSKRVAAQKRAQEYLDVWSYKNDIKPFRRPVLISLTVWRKKLRGDESNLVTPFDKLILDALTERRGNKKRGMGIIVDDSPEYMKLLPPTLRRAVNGKEKTLVRFIAWRKGEKIILDTATGDVQVLG